MTKQIILIKNDFVIASILKPPEILLVVMLVTKMRLEI